MSEYKISNEYITATISSMGAELISLKRNKDGKEYIWDGNPKFWKRHSPVLFPLIGKYKNNQSCFDGKEYQMGQHGFARDTEFTLKSQTDTEIWLYMTDSASTLEKYPFHFQFECGFKLDQSSVKVLWNVTNMDNQTIYFSLGAHPAFVIPAATPESTPTVTPTATSTATLASTRSMVDCKLEFKHAGKSLDNITYSLLSSDGLMIDENHMLPLVNGDITITADMFNQDALVIENYQADQVCIKDANDHTFVIVSFDTPVLGIWSPMNSNVPFVCIEPWYGRCDRTDFSSTLKDREWGNTLDAGERFTRSYTITIA